MSERVTAWRCIGCGRIEAPQPCIGVCQDRKVELVSGAEYDRLVEELAATRARLQAMIAVLRQLGHTTPRAGECERTYRALQARARRTLDEFGGMEAGEIIS